MDTLERYAKKMKVLCRYILFVMATFCVLSCSKPKLELTAGGILTSPEDFKIGNLTVLRIDPNGRSVSIDWKGYNLRSGSALNVPFEIIVIESGDEKYVISDEEAGNNELTINDRLYSFNSQKEQILIRFGDGISVINGGNYQEAQDPYDFKFAP